MTNIVLYHLESCPYCKKVTDFLKGRAIEVEMKERSDPQVKQELVTIGGKSQVPCLVINGEALYESDAIITWFENEYN